MRFTQARHPPHERIFQLARNAPSDLRRVLRNFGKLLSGKAAAGVIGLFTLMMVTRSLGVTGYGVLTLISGYVTLVGSFVALSGFHAVVRYGAEARAAGDHARLLRLLRLSSVLELGFGALAVGVAAALVPLVGPRLSWPPHAVTLAVPFSLAALAGVRATPQGVLQIAGRFDLIALHQTVQPLVRVIGTAIGWSLGWKLGEFLIVWLVAALVECASMWIMAALVLRGMRLQTRWRGGLRGVRDDNPGVLRFIMAANVDLTLQELAPNLTPLTVGWMLGAEAAGLFALSQRACNVLQQPAVLLGQAIFSTLAGQSARSDYRGVRRLVRRSMRVAVLSALPLLVVFGLFGRGILHLLGGHGFSAKPELLMVLAGSRVVRLGAQPLTAGLTALGQPGRSVGISLLSDIVLYPLLPGLIALSGLIGAGWHSLVQETVGFTLRLIVFRKRVKTMPTGREGESEKSPARA